MKKKEIKGKHGIKSSKQIFLKNILKYVLKIFFCFIIVSLIQVVTVRFINIPFILGSSIGWFSDAIRGRDFNGLRAKWKPLSEISPYVRRAVLAAEDQRFTEHGGFDYIEIGNAVKKATKGHKLRGASTISMQTARTVFLWEKRSVSRKLLEIYYTFLIECLWSKQRILEVYLNTVDWGDDIMGIESASREYFKVSAAALTVDQAAALAAILPNPHYFDPVKPDAATASRIIRIKKDMSVMPLLQ